MVLPRNDSQWLLIPGCTWSSDCQSYLPLRHWHNFSLSVSEAVGGTCCLLTTSTATMASFHPTAAHSFANYVFLENSEDGGNRLADKLLRYKGKSDQVTVVALPRGGVMTGYYIAKGLGLPLDVIIARKIGCPFHEELALGRLM